MMRTESLRPIGWRRFCAASMIAIVVFSSSVNAQRFVSRTKVRVSEPTRIDWGFAVTGRSFEPADDASPLAEIVSGYRSTFQRYNLYAPLPNTVTQPMPLVLFISYRGTPVGWDAVGPTCVREGIIYAEPFNAGNATKPAERIRIVLDCLDDVRRRYRIDPDRTYIGGYSGGAAIASRIAFALPEYFGGLLASNTAFGPPLSPWQRDRIANRVSIAMIVGERESPGFEMGKVQTPILKSLDVRAYCQVLPRRGHTLPPAAIFDSALRWLEAGVGQRRQTAQERPVLRIDGNPTRQQWAAAALQDCNELLGQEAMIHVALGVLSDLKRRWPDLPEAEEAETLIREYESRTNQPWVAVAREERLARTVLLADVYDSAASAVSGAAKSQRAVYAQGAIDNYRLLITESDDRELIDKARMRIPVMNALVENVPIKIRSTIPVVPSAIPDDSTEIAELSVTQRFNLKGQVNAGDLLTRLESHFAPDDPKFNILSERIDRAGLTLDRWVAVDADQLRLHEVLYRVLTPIGLAYRDTGTHIEILPADFDDQE